MIERLRLTPIKKEFFDELYKAMATSEDIYMLFCGLGYPRVDEFLAKYPNRAFNTEASEQTALDIAVGLAYAGKTVFVYTITPFLLRGFETIRTYINHENLNIKLIGAGRDDDYSIDDGFSHDASDIKGFLDLLPNIKKFWPEDKEEIPAMLDLMLTLNDPCFISLRR